MTNDRKSRSPKLLVFAITLSACILGVSYLGLVNLGLPFGYYGQLNQVKKKLKAIPTVTIRGVRGNYDLTLEDFTLDLTIGGLYDISLYFHEPPSPSWQFFEEADGFMLRCRRDGSIATWEAAYHRWWFPLGADCGLGEQLGIKLENLHDVLTHFESIMHLIEATPLEILDRERAMPDSRNRLMNIEIGISTPSS